MASYRSNVSRAARLRGYLSMAQQHRGSFAGGGLDNPAASRRRRSVAEFEPYDPRLESVRSMRQGMYESSVMADYGGKGEFRDGDGVRFDVKMGIPRDPEAIKKYVSGKAFSMATGVARNHGFLIPGTQDPTPKAAERSYQRYHDDPDHLLINRQDYEETIGMARQSGFYRVVAEPTYEGTKYFVWPLRPGDGVPKGYSTLAQAEAVCETFNQKYNPMQTGRWWTPPSRMYTHDDLKDWLPPDSAFGLGRK